ncbi:MAG TPA: tRNA glutamyl-Q(34) synthetase GluQRS [Polyangiaceae bacterium]|nr:tRNA glutamyl-Q(34) synthetase GluQRS [Polyangiaceae bacterium]
MPLNIGRLAPSPTGHMHLGHARTFLLAYWSIRQKGGRLLLRLEDLDQERSASKYIDATLRDFEWLGIEWDGAPQLQSERVHQIRAQALALYRSGHAYPCTCTKADLRAALSAPQEGQSELRYSGRCRGRYAALESAESAPGKGVALRFAVPEGLVTVEDQFVGPATFDVAAECGDFLVLRKDQVPSYQLAVVADDAVSGVTEVVRGDDLLPSAARQQLLQRTLGWDTPRWFHVPLVVDELGRRLAKRADDLSLACLRERGIDPRAIVGWVARNSGWPKLQRARACELSAEFAWERVPHARVAVSNSIVDELAT